MARELCFKTGQGVYKLVILRGSPLPPDLRNERGYRLGGVKSRYLKDLYYTPSNKGLRLRKSQDVGGLGRHEEAKPDSADSIDTNAVLLPTLILRPKRKTRR